MATDLYWLPANQQWKQEAKQVTQSGERPLWAELVKLARSRLDFLQTNQLDRILSRFTAEGGTSDAPAIRLAILSSSTVKHLIPGIRVGALRRGLLVEVFEADYGQYMQELAGEGTALERFQPTAILLAFDSHHMATMDVRAADLDVADQSFATIERCWELAKKRFHCPLIQQTLLPIFEPLLGNNEWRLTNSPLTVVNRINALIRERADAYGVEIVALDERVAIDGLEAWYSPTLWFRAKQELDPRIAPLYGELVARLLAAERGRSAKCIVLDLDNTLWGGVIGDDGLEGITLGQGTSLGEAYASFQRYVLRLSQRGVILAVCSKNDEVNALLPFEGHTEMVLRRSDIACFSANWEDKASNLRSIAKTLNIGIDSLVFIDDNPFEREQVRSELPSVAVPELPEDPSYYARTIADAGYFEALSITNEDRVRGMQYQANAEREKVREQASDMGAYLSSLGMKLIAGPFDSSNAKRVTQLVNKTNQFNVTTKRYSDDEIEHFMNSRDYIDLQMKLLDRFGDNGIISVVIGKVEDSALFLDTWLMSCRVLGRQVEEAALNLVVEKARERQLLKLVGVYKPTEKNGMVRDLYSRLGFQLISSDDAGVTTWELSLSSFDIRSHYMEVVQEVYATS